MRRFALLAVPLFLIGCQTSEESVATPKPNKSTSAAQSTQPGAAEVARSVKKTALVAIRQTEGDYIAMWGAGIAQVLDTKSMKLVGETTLTTPPERGSVVDQGRELWI